MNLYEDLIKRQNNWKGKQGMMVRRKHINDAVSTARSKQDHIYIAITGVKKIKGIQKEKK